MESKQCAGCGESFHPRSQTPKQTYCASSACQRERRRRWQQARRQADPDYRENQARAQAAWVARHPDYWREYRRSHPEVGKRMVTPRAFTTLRACATNSMRRSPDRSTPKLLAQLARFQPLLIDELGYLTLKPEQSNAFFRLMDQRYGRVSTIITTNLEPTA